MAKYESHRKVELLAGRRRLIGPGNSWRERESTDQADRDEGSYT